MGKYCCFQCPAKADSEKSLDELCPNCDEKYGFPLFDAPKTIEQHRVVEPLGRGFYAATYVTEHGPLRTKSVLKVSPKEFFDFFPDKDFEAECRTHVRVANGTEHIVDIRDMFDSEVIFRDMKIPCHVAELEYIEGRLLADYLSPDHPISTKTAAQIAIDLFKIREELQKKRVYHNDLHAENVIIQSLTPDASRGNAIDDSIRAVAIDLGSVAERSRSDSHASRSGDLHQIAEHLNSLIDRLLRDPDKISDSDNRIARALQLIIQTISPGVENQRTPESAEFIRDIENSYYRATQHWRPWREPLTLKTFSASYNAQTMHAWHVPQLLVDPDEQWLNKISAPGPQVITGMRGCGKTMLLRALQFHARAASRENEPNENIVKRLKEDNYVGLFVSAQRLLNRLGDETVEEQNPFERLFVAYGLEAIRAIRHLRDVSDDLVSRQAREELADAISGCIANMDNLHSASSIDDLDSHVDKHLISLDRSRHEYSLNVDPHVAFCRLSEALRNCSQVWQTARVLFLLDDVSTRYLDPPRIEELLSVLLFQDSGCAFKLTSERQTLALHLKSPGQNHPVRIGRDLSVFDLGAEVYEKIKRPGKGNGRHFVEKILEQRKEYFPSHPPVSPSALLGDVQLEALAVKIGQSENSSRERKEVYHGITALALMCVGDIGDVISLYEQILKVSQDDFPVAPKIQSDCFQDFCARRLYDLNRRNPFLMDVAKSFAEASHELLVDSWRQPPSSGKKKRIRQYLSLYVRITTGDFKKQTDQLRELIDAGVFVFAGGSHVPRAKTRDSNPMQQFKLTYRKIYGLVNFIGLAERDRFELSGSDLEEWLSEPKRGKEILLRNHARCGSGSAQDDGETAEKTQEIDKPDQAMEPRQLLVPLGGSEDNLAEQAIIDQDQDQDQDQDREIKVPEIKYHEDRFPPDVSIDCLIVGLGFEDRTLESARRLCSTVRPRTTIALEYQEAGKSTEIVQEIERSKGEFSKRTYDNDTIRDGLPTGDGNTVIDITGLAKPIIFQSVRNELRRKGSVWICYTEAENYYPLDADLIKVHRKGGHLLEGLKDILTGEDGPYEIYRLLRPDSNDSRQRALFAFSSSKHERLLSLLERRDYDLIEIVAPVASSHRDDVALAAAEIAARNYPNSSVVRIHSRDIDKTLSRIVNRYRRWYIRGGLNFELGLTGSKLQAVACAAASAIFKMSQCWYLQPKRFDPQRFTKGVGRTHFYRISL